MDATILFFLTINIIKIAQSFEQINTKIDPQIKCFINFQKTSFENDIVIFTFPNMNTQTDELIKLLKSTNPVLQLVNFNGNEDNFTIVPQKFSTHVLIISNEDEYEYFLNKTYGTAIWNANGKYFVMYYGEKDVDVGRIFQMSWKRYVVNIDVIVDANVFTYFPYDISSKCGRNIRAINLGSCSNVLNLFPNKIPSNFNKCVVRIFVNLYPPFVIQPETEDDVASLAGFDLAIINAFVKKYNLSRSVIGEAGAFAHYSNGKYSGSLRYIMENITDVASGSLFPNISFFIDMDVAIFHQYVHFSWVVPAAKLGAQWKSLILIFNKYLWFTILLILLCNFIIWWVFAKYTSDYKDFEDLSACILKCWYSFLQGGIKLPFSLPMRVLIITWALFSLLLGTLYQSQLLSILLTPVYEHQISNAEELVQSKVGVYFKSDFSMRLKNSGRPTDKGIVEKGYIVSTVEHAQISSTYHENKAFLGNRAATLYLMPRNYSYPSGKPAMFMCEGKEFGNPISMFFRKGYPLLPKYNWLLLRMFSSGLTTKWMSDATFFVQKKSGDSEPQKFTLFQLSGAFFVLALGLIGSLLIFISELATHKWHRNI